ncbi:MAG: hypothetical protein KGI69_01800 [Patescibacteria group bacterium]|nr:hypothetical protein [Patescibacteria group bacterium]
MGIRGREILHRPEQADHDAAKETMRLLLTKSFSREHSLFYCYVWNDSDMIGLPKYADMSPNSLFQGEGRGKRLSVWYNQAELDMLFGNIEKKISADPRYFANAKSEFYKWWDLLLPYIKKEKKIGSIDCIEDFYDIFVKWWSPMASIIYIPDMKDAPEDIKKEAFKIRDETQHYSDDGDRLFIEFFLAHYPEYTDIAYVISPTEVFSLKDGPLSQQALAEIRKRLDGYIVHKGKLYLASELDKVLEANKLELEKPKTEDLKEIKGVPASKGKAKGPIKLVLYKEQIKTVKEGDILVTEMTSPDFVPAMKRSAAIITDEGGITCHAAIASRELGKPCIIGTKIATQVFKDGDLVEVDADRGLVRKI